jgi:hypothetical protein
VFCNGAEICQGNVCAAGADPCDDAVGCTVDACDEAGQICRHTPDDGLCDNGLFCDGAEVCDALLDCQPSGDPCVGELCDEAGDACVECLVDADCDDGVFCNGAEICQANVCAAGADPCAGELCDEAGDACVECLTGADCDDGVFCNGTESCQANVCAVGADPCAGQVCDEAGDACAECLVDADCDDGLFCNGAESCQGNVCAAGDDPCDDAVGCTADVCDEVGQSCSYTPDAALCDNGLFCDGAETCDAVLGCSAGTDPCAGEMCDENGDACVECRTDQDCDDGLDCNGAGTCESVPERAQSREQQRCIVRVNAAGLRVMAAQGQQNRRCLRDAARGSLPGTAETCVETDPRGRVAKASSRVTRTDQRLCAPAGVTPDFAYTDAVTASRAARVAALGLVHDIFGDSVDDGVLSCAEDRAACACQRVSSDKIERLMVAMGKEFARCVRAQLKSGAATNVSAIEACVDDALLDGSVARDARGRIARRRAQLLKAVTKACDGAGVTAAAFAEGACSEATVSATLLTGCAADRAECRFCLMVDEMDGLGLDCDGFDDGLANQSCTASE